MEAVIFHRLAPWEALSVLPPAERLAVVVAVGIAARLVAFLRDIDFASDNGVDALSLGGVIELHGAEKVPVIGHGHRRHFLLFDQLHELIDLACAVEQRIVGVAMQVDKGHRAFRLLARGRVGVPSILL